MNGTHQILDYLPYLRRFARSLYGEQIVADELVERVTRTLTEAAGDSVTRASLYRAFLDIADEPNVWSGYHGGPDLSTARPELRISRRAYLLRNLEGFSASETADVLGITSEQAAKIFGADTDPVQKSAQRRAVIVEDEPLIAIELDSLLDDMGHNVLGVARTRADAVTLVAQAKPDLVLCDVQLADGSSGIDATNEFLGIHQAAVVFITAFPERLLTGQRPEPTFMISKPFRRQAVDAIITQALAFAAKADTSRS